MELETDFNVVGLCGYAVMEFEDETVYGYEPCSKLFWQRKSISFVNQLNLKRNCIDVGTFQNTCKLLKTLSKTQIQIVIY